MESSISSRISNCIFLPEKQKVGTFVLFWEKKQTFPTRNQNQILLKFTNHGASKSIKMCRYQNDMESLKKDLLCILYLININETDD
jgi:hypothetical protein